MPTVHQRHRRTDDLRQQYRASSTNNFGIQPRVLTLHQLVVFVFFYVINYLWNVYAVVTVTASLQVMRRFSLLIHLDQLFLYNSSKVPSSPGSSAHLWLLIEARSDKPTVHLRKGASCIYPQIGFLQRDSGPSQESVISSYSAESGTPVENESGAFLRYRTLGGSIIQYFHAKLTLNPLKTFVQPSEGALVSCPFPCLIMATTTNGLYTTTPEEL